MSVLAAAHCGQDPDPGFSTDRLLRDFPVFRGYEVLYRGPRLVIGAQRRHGRKTLETEDHFLLLDGYCLFDREWGGPESRVDTPAGDELEFVSTCYRRYGDRAWSRLEGNFRLLLVDKVRGTLHCVTDRFNRQPLVYLRASALDALLIADSVRPLLPFVHERKLAPEALAESVHYRHLCGEQHLVAPVQQLHAAAHMRVSAGGAGRVECYWEPHFERQGREAAVEPWADALETALERHIRRLARRFRHAAVLLSAGTDSSLIAAIACRHFESIVAITPSWADGGNPELEQARRFAAHLGIPHLSPKLTSEDLRLWCGRLVGRLEQLPRHFSSMPLGAALERLPGNVEVVLHGESADTLFGKDTLTSLPALLRRQALCGLLPAGVRRAIAGRLPHDARASKRWRGAKRRWPWLDLAALSRHSCDWRRALTGYPDQIPLEYHRIVSYREMAEVFAFLDDRMQPGDRFSEAFLRDDLDWATKIRKLDLQAHHPQDMIMLERLLEPRRFFVAYPFLSQEVLEVGCALPPELFEHGGYSKPVVRGVCARYYPHQWVYEKSKHGFYTPHVPWLRGPLKGYVELVAEEHTRDRGLLRPGVLEGIDLAHDPDLMWTLIHLELFQREFLDRTAASSAAAA